MSSSCFPSLITFVVSKATLDIVCSTAFGYKSDSLHNPHNELAEAYENLISLQDGDLKNLLPQNPLNVAPL